MDPNFKDRTLLTSIGQKMREINPDVWANYIIQQTKDKDFCLIDDLRYQNEYELLAKEGWRIIQLTISKELQEERIKKMYLSNYQDHLKNRNHPSELNSFQWINQGPDLIIDSSQNREDIEMLVNSFIQQKH